MRPRDARRGRAGRCWSVGLVALLVAALPSLAIPAGAGPRPAPRVSGCAADARLEVCFSSPGGARADPAVINRIRALIRAAGPGDRLRIAMFRWDVARAADELLAAQRRGALVQVVADNDVLGNRVGRRLLREVERRDRRHDNVVVCRGSCLPWRGNGPVPTGQNVNHLKLLLTDIDGVRSVTVTSSNLVGRQYHQYNSLVRVTDPGTYAFYAGYFQRLRRQSLRADGQTWTDADKAHTGSPTVVVYPRRTDLVVSTLRHIRCTKGMRQVDVMVAVIQRYDVRRQLGLLHRAGCRVRIVVDRENVENWLQARVGLRNGTSVRLPARSVRTARIHDKAISIHARLGGRETWLVLTGTSNATCGALLYNDEVMMRFGGRWVYHQYAAHFADAFARAHQSRTPRQVPVQNHCS